jgi:hypothetical protein
MKTGDFIPYLKCVVIFLLLQTLITVNAQDTKKTLTAYFSEVRSGKYQSIPKNLFQPENAKATLAAVVPYLKDSSAIVRAKAYALVQLVGNTTRQDNLREDAVTKLVEGVKDRDSGNAGLAIGYLQGFRKEDYTSDVKDTLVNMLKRHPPHLKEYIKLIGFLELTQTRNDLRTLAQQGSASRQDRWAALLALARMGDSYAKDDVIKRVSKLPVNDEVVYQIYPDLVYTRQKEIITLLIDQLNSDVKNCESADAERPANIPCAYRIMEMLAPAIEGYPVKLDASGDIDAKDYTEALQKVRVWFKEHPDYKISKDKF